MIDVDGTEYCLTDVATHEFGHWVSLKDLTIYSGCYSSYSHYTMWAETNKNAHWRESPTLRGQVGAVVHLSWRSLEWQN